MLTLVAIAAYAASMIAANFAVATYGPAITPLVAFCLVGMDLALRDWLHARLEAEDLFILIAGSSIVTYALNPATGMIALASACAFALAAIADWAVFVHVPGSWLRRSNTSNVAGAAVDSLVFPTLAFGALMPGVVVMQFAAKVLGGAVWSWLFSRSARA